MSEEKNNVLEELTQLDRIEMKQDLILEGLQYLLDDIEEIDEEDEVELTNKGSQYSQ